MAGRAKHELVKIRGAGRGRPILYYEVHHPVRGQAGSRLIGTVKKHTEPTMEYRADWNEPGGGYHPLPKGFGSPGAAAAALVDYDEDRK